MSSRPRTLPAVLAALLLMGCASAGSQGGGLAPPPEAPGSIQAYASETNVRVASDRNVVSANVLATPAAAWKALAEVYKDIGVPVTQQDPSRHILGNPRFVVRRQFLGQRVSNFVSCGDDMMGPIANRASIVLNVRSAVVADADGQARVDVLLGAVEGTTEGTSTSGGVCHSTQRLEHDILKRVQLKLVKSRGKDAG